MKKTLAVLTVIATAITGSAGDVLAQSSRLYFAGYLGLNTHTENEFSESATDSSGDFEFKNAVSLAGALGLRLTPQWRLEGEISRRTADLDRADLAGGNSFKTGGDIKTWLYMLNLYYDVDWTWKNFQPFLTAGFGLAGHEAVIDDSSGLLVDATDDSSLGFAWQLGGGLKYRLNPDTAITSNYRYLGTQDMEVDSYDVEYTTHEFRIGLEYDLPTDWLQ